MYCTSMLLSQELKMLYIRPPINTQQLCLNKYSLRLMSSTGSSGAGGGKLPGAGSNETTAATEEKGTRKQKEAEILKSVEELGEINSKMKAGEALKKPELEKLLNISTTTAKELEEKHKPKHMSFEDAREAAWKRINLQKRHFEDRIDSIRNIFSKKPDSPRTQSEEWYYKRVSFWMKRYENFVGLTDVKASQARVVECEKRFIEMQEKRREAQINIAEVQKRIKEIHMELDKTHRGDDKYLALITQEHNVLKEIIYLFYNAKHLYREEKTISEQFKFFEKAERESFAALSNSVRDSHESERAQAEKTKYWSILGSIIGTCIGIIGTTINNRLRMRELRQLVAKNSTVEEVQAIGEDLIESLDAHEKELSDLTIKVEQILNQAKSGLSNLDKMEGLVETLKESSEKINTNFLESTLNKVLQSQELLSGYVGQHQKELNEKLEGMKNDILVQSTNVNNLAHIQLKDRDRDQRIRSEREAFIKKSFETITQQNSDLETSMNSYSKDIDDKVKDVRSLLINDQRIPKLENRLLDRLTSMETRQKELIQHEHETSIGSIKTALSAAVSSSNTAAAKRSSAAVDVTSLEAVLEEHHARDGYLNNFTILITIFVA